MNGPASGWSPPVATVPGNRPPQRRAGCRRPVTLVLAILAAMLTGGWLLAQHPGMLGTAGQPSAQRHGSWLSGSWTGSASQPTGRVTHWKADLSFADSGRAGTFRFPTLGCSGKLVKIKVSGRAASARQDMTVNSRRLCVPDGLIRLRRTGTKSLDMTWQDPNHSRNVATARLKHVG